MLAKHLVIITLTPYLTHRSPHPHRVYLAWRQAWSRAALSLSHRDSAQHRIALMTNKPIPSGIFA